MFRLKMLSPLFVLWLLTGSAAAAIYSWTDGEGNRVYSDKPHAGAQTIELGPTNVIQPTTPSASSGQSSSKNSKQPAGNFYRELRISSPADDSNLRSNEGALSISVHMDPPLNASHLLKLSLDGELSDAGVPGNGTPNLQLTAHGIDRGSHTIAAVVVNARGEELQRSSPITVHLQRTSLNQPGRGGANQAPKAPAAPRAPNVPKPGG